MKQKKRGAELKRQSKAKAKPKSPPTIPTEEMIREAEAREKANAPPPQLIQQTPEQRYRLPLPSKHDQLIRQLAKENRIKRLREQQSSVKPKSSGEVQSSGGSPGSKGDIPKNEET